MRRFVAEPQSGDLLEHMGTIANQAIQDNLNWAGASYTTAEAPKGSMTYTAANLGLAK